MTDKPLFAGFVYDLLNNSKDILFRGIFKTKNYFLTVEDEVVVLLSAGGRSIIRNIDLDYSLWVPFYPNMDKLRGGPFPGITIPIKNKSG